MRCGFFPHSQGSAATAVNYIVGEYQHDGSRRKTDPIILRGDPQMTIDISEASVLEHTHTSGALSFKEGEEPTIEQMNAVMDDFELMAFGRDMPADERNILWVMHKDHAHTELHFVINRESLITGQELNIKPPTEGGTEHWDIWERSINLEYLWTRPDIRVNDFSTPRWESKGKSVQEVKDSPDYNKSGEARFDSKGIAFDENGKPTIVGKGQILTREFLREQINNTVAMAIGQGEITSREEMVEYLDSLDGYEVIKHKDDPTKPRSETSISLKVEGFGSNIRLNHGLYSAKTWEQENDRNLSIKDAELRSRTLRDRVGELYHGERDRTLERKNELIDIRTSRFNERVRRGSNKKDRDDIELDGGKVEFSDDRAVEKNRDSDSTIESTRDENRGVSEAAEAGKEGAEQGSSEDFTIAQFSGQDSESGRSGSKKSVDNKSKHGSHNSGNSRSSRTSGGAGGDSSPITTMGNDGTVSLSIGSENESDEDAKARIKNNLDKQINAFNKKVAEEAKRSAALYASMAALEAESARQQQESLQILKQRESEYVRQYVNYGRYPKSKSSRKGADVGSSDLQERSGQHKGADGSSTARESVDSKGVAGRSYQDKRTLSTENKQFYKLYNVNPTDPEKLDGYRLFNSKKTGYTHINSKALKAGIIDKGSDIDCKSKDPAGMKASIEMALQVAEAKGWDISKVKFQGEPEFLQMASEMRTERLDELRAEQERKTAEIEKELQLGQERHLQQEKERAAVSKLAEEARAEVAAKFEKPLSEILAEFKESSSEIAANYVDGRKIQDETAFEVAKSENIKAVQQWYDKCRDDNPTFGLPSEHLGLEKEDYRNLRNDIHKFGKHHAIEKLAISVMAEGKGVEANISNHNKAERLGEIIDEAKNKNNNHDLQAIAGQDELRHLEAERKSQELAEQREQERLQKEAQKLAEKEAQIQKQKAADKDLPTL